MASLERGVAPDPGRRKRILIVEDEFLSAMALEQILHASGFQVLGIAGDTDTALALAAKAPPDLLISDIKLRDGGDGVTVAAIIRELYGVPCIFVSGNMDQRTMAQAARAMPVACIEKPYGEPQLLQAIRTALAVCGERCRAARPMTAA